MKRKIALMICLMFCLSLLSNVVYAAQETEVKKEQEQQEQKITSIEELSEEIRNSTWFKNGLKNGVYDSFNSFGMVGNAYMGENIEDILLMSEEIKGFKLSEFFEHTVFSIYSIKDLKAFKEKGLITMDEVYEKIYLPEKGKAKNLIKKAPILRAAGSQSATMSTATTRIDSFQLPGKSPHGQLWQLTLDGDYGFCAGYGMAAKKGFSYSKTSNMAEANIVNETMKKQVFTAIAYFQDECTKVGGDQHWVDEAYLISQVWVWVALEGISDAELASKVARSVPDLTSEQTANLRNTVQEYLNSGKTKLDGDVYYYTSSNANAQPVITWKGEPYTPPKTGWAKVKKQSSKPELTNGNNSYSLAGAEYGIFTDEGCTDKVATITTDSNGDSNEAELNSGTYWLKELKAPSGFFLNDTPQSIEIAAGQINKFDVVNIPKIGRAHV